MGRKQKQTPPKEKLTSIEALTAKLSEQQSNVNLEIECIYSQIILKYSQIPLHLIYDKCIQLDLNLKGFTSNQDDFDAFCSQISSFKQLDTFSIRFYNKQVRSLDSLFNNIVNIRKVSLNLKNFKKIKLSSEFSYPMNRMQDFSINLKNITFKDKQSRQILENFISRQQALNTFRVSLKKLDYLKFLLATPENTNLYLNLLNPSVDLNFCDELIKFKKQYGLKQLFIEQSQIMIGVYLQSQGIDLVNYYLKTSDQNIIQNYKFHQFTPQDMQLLDKVPYFLDFILKKTECPLSLWGDQTQAELVYKLIHPKEHLFKNISFNFFNFGFTIDKKDNIWYIDSPPLWEANKHFSFLLKNCINIRINLMLHCLIKVNETIMVMQMIQDNQYFISYQIVKSNPYHYQINGQNQINQIKLFQELLTDQQSVVQQKIIDKMRYFAFLKYLYELIPLPQQIFYDLIEI